MRKSRQWAASEGQIYVCGACGKTGRTPATIGDESCLMHAVLCIESSLRRRPDGRVEYAEAVKR